MSQANAHEQFMLELINAERANVGVQPLAFDGDLNESSENHSDWMISTNIFSHSGEGGSNPGDRMKAAGYVFTGNWTWGENIARMSIRAPDGLQDEVQQLHTNLMNSSGHRANLLNNNFREIGVGFEVGQFGNFDNAVVTQNFARTTSDYFLTGVTFNDLDSDNHYDIGEGFSNATVRARNNESGVVITTTTNVGGGYDLELANGAYTVSFSSNSFATIDKQISINNKNVKLDLINPDVTSGNHPTEVIVDNQDGLSTGIWSNSSGVNPFGSNSVYTNVNGASFTWNPDLNADGAYDVAARWTYWANRDTAVNYAVHHVSGVTNITVNQRDNTLGGEWNNLGRFTLDQSSYVEVIHDGGANTTSSADAFRFTPGTLSVNSLPIAENDIFISNQDLNIIGNVLVDNGNGVDSDPDGGALTVVAGTFVTSHGTAILKTTGDFTYTPDAGYVGSDSFSYTLEDAQGGTDIGRVNLTLNTAGNDSSEVIVDNQDGAHTSSTGTWSTSSGTNPYSGNSVYANANGERFTWSPNFDVDGTYDVAAWWTYWTNRDTTVTYEVHHINGITDVTVNQHDASLAGQWNDLGHFVMDENSYVTLVHDGGASTTSSADALRYTRTANDDLDQTIIGTSGADTLSGGIGNDMLSGLAGADILYGNAGDDMLFGGFGFDTLDGGTGSDTADFTHTTSAVDISLVLNQAVFSSGTENLVSIENIIGSNGQNVITGDDGDNILDGAGSNDTLTGGGGVDTFVFSVNGGLDTVTDFSTIQSDTLDIASLLTGYNPLTDAITDFVQITDNGADSILSVDSDGGANNFAQIVTLVGVIGLTDEAALEISGNLMAI